MRRKLKALADIPYNDETLRLLDDGLASFSEEGELCNPCFVAAAGFVDAGGVAERMGRFVEAGQYYDRARRIYYEDWGALAPAAWVEERCQAVRINQAFVYDSTSPISTSLDELVGGIVRLEEPVSEQQ